MAPIIAVLIVIFVIAILSMSIKVVNEYERGVIFRLGRLMGAKGPGFFMIIPFIDRMVKIDLRVVTLDVPHRMSSPAIMLRCGSAPLFISALSIPKPRW